MFYRMLPTHHVVTVYMVTSEETLVNQDQRCAMEFFTLYFIWHSKVDTITIHYQICLQGPKGYPGPDGPRGYDGLPGKDGHYGLKGEDGDSGHEGPRGEQGQCFNVDGAPGPQGEMGEKGEKVYTQ